MAVAAVTSRPPGRLKLTAVDPQDWIGGGPGGGVVCRVVISPHAPETLYAGINGGGIFKSTNGGGRWTAASRGLPPFSGCALTIDPRDADVLFTEVLGRIYKTTDGGANWVLSDAGLPEAHLPAVAVLQPNRLYAATDGGLFRSADGGERWEIVRAHGLPDGSLEDVLVDPSDPSTLYVRSRAAVFRSRDAARTFTAIGAGLPAEDVEQWTIDAMQPATLFVATRDHGVFKTTNRGDSWTLANAGLPAEVPESLTIDPTNSSVVYAATARGLFATADGGGHWTRNESLGTGVSSVAVHPSQPALLYAATSAGVLTSADGGLRWTGANAGITRTSPSDLVVLDSAGQTLMLRSSTGVLESVDGGQHWAHVKGVPGAGVLVLAADPNHPGTIYAGVGDRELSDIYRSTDSGATWSRRAVTMDDSERPIPQGSAGAAAALPRYGAYTLDAGSHWRMFKPRIPGASLTTGVRIHPTNSQVVFAESYFQGLHRSADGGNTWTRIADLPNSSSAGAYSLFFDAKAAGTIYARTHGIYIESSEGDLYKSVDGGRNWTQLVIRASRNVPIDFLAVTATTPTILFSGYWTNESNNSFVLLKSADQGVRWTEVSSGLPRAYAEPLSLASAPENPSVIYVSISGHGVFKSTNGGRSWFPTGSAQPQPD